MLRQLPLVVCVGVPQRKTASLVSETSMADEELVEAFSLLAQLFCPLRSSHTVGDQRDWPALSIVEDVGRHKKRNNAVKMVETGWINL